MRARLLHTLARLRHRLSSERGFAVPTVMLMTVAAMGVASVGVITSVQGQRGVVRDQGTKSALAVAESGVDEALLRFNRYGLATETDRCAPVGPAGPDANGWCGPIDAMVDDGAVSYYVSPAGASLPGGGVAWGELDIVSSGTINGVTRRVNVHASSASGQSIFSTYAVKSLDDVVVEANSTIKSGTATNGEVDLVNKSTSRQCGQVSVGIGQPHPDEGHYSDLECTTTGDDVIEDEVVLPPVNQGDAATNNDNERITNALTGGVPRDQISGNKNPVSWDAETRELAMVGNNNTSLTLGGSVYSFCSVKLESNSALYFSENTYVYFDSPEACGYDPGTIQLELDSNSRITSVGSGNVAMLFVGEGGVHLKSNTSVGGSCQQNFIIYGPGVDVVMDQNTRFCGAAGGNSVYLKSKVELLADSKATSFILPNVAPHYVADRFVDCTAEAAAASVEGC